MDSTPGGQSVQSDEDGEPMIETAPASTPVIRTLIHTKERRYAFEDVRDLERFLRKRGNPVEYVPGRPETEITTVYLDTREGTWSVGRTRTKFRCKSYQDPSLYWFEIKQRRGLKVDKRRQSVVPGDLPPILEGLRRGPILARWIGSSPLLPLVAVKYRRTAYEFDDVRLTIDRDVRFLAVEPGEPWRIGRVFGRKAGFVVEIKRDGGVPIWLKAGLGGRRRQRFSKSRWALLARSRSWAR
jgi:hypothetical protein